MESLLILCGIVCNKDDAYSLKDALSLVGFFMGYRIDTHHAIEGDGGHYLTHDNYQTVSDWVLEGIE